MIFFACFLVIFAFLITSLFCIDEGMLANILASRVTAGVSTINVVHCSADSLLFVRNASTSALVPIVAVMRRSADRAVIFGLVTPCLYIRAMWYPARNTSATIPNILPDVGFPKRYRAQPIPMRARVCRRIALFA